MLLARPSCRCKSQVRAHCAATGRAGFFLRILQEGDVQEGDVLKVVERPWPQWTLARVSHLVYGAAAKILRLKGGLRVQVRLGSVAFHEKSDEIFACAVRFGRLLRA